MIQGACLLGLLMCWEVLLLLILLTLYIGVPPEKFFCTFRKNVSKHIIDLSLLLAHLNLYDFLMLIWLLANCRFLIGSWCLLHLFFLLRGLVYYLWLFLSLLVLNEEERGRDGVLKESLGIKIPVLVAADWSGVATSALLSGLLLILRVGVLALSALISRAH